MDLSIKGIESKNKAQIKPSNMPDIIPNAQAGFRVMMSGPSRSGKSNLIQTLISDERFFGGPEPYHDLVFVFSGSARTDDSWDTLKDKYIKKQHFIDGLDLDELDKIWNIQEKLVIKHGVHNAPRILIVLDDVIDNKAVTNPIVGKVFYRGRHIGINIMIATQKYNKIPLSFRDQLTNIFIFEPKARAARILADDLTPAGYNEKNFRAMLGQATKVKYDFLHIDLTAPADKMYRKNLGEFLTLSI
jgi:hypothetical protein